MPKNTTAPQPAPAIEELYHLAVMRIPFANLFTLCKANGLTTTGGRRHLVQRIFATGRVRCPLCRGELRIRAMPYSDTGHIGLRCQACAYTWIGPVAIDAAGKRAEIMLPPPARIDADAVSPLDEIKHYDLLAFDTDVLRALCRKASLEAAGSRREVITRLFALGEVRCVMCRGPLRLKGPPSTDSGPLSLHCPTCGYRWHGLARIDRTGGT